MLFPRIVFYGTPDFAVASLQKLVEAGYPVVCVVTPPDRPAGRGLKLKASPVKEFATACGIPVLQPLKLKDPGFLQNIAALKPDLQIVIAFRMMPVQLWSLPPLGTINLHASLLPQYRGAAPIHWAIINGERETGVTAFFLNEAIDHGRILLSEKVLVDDHETTGELHDRLMHLGSHLLVRTVKELLDGSLQGVDQDTLAVGDQPLKMAPKIQKEDCRIHWDGDGRSVYNFIRGLSPYPGAFTEIKTEEGFFQPLKIFRADYVQVQNPMPPGRFLTDGKTGLKVSVGDGFIDILELQFAGRKAMNIVDFLRGYGRLFSETHGNRRF